MTPLATGIQDDDGLLVFEVQTGARGFDGYLRVRAPVHDCYDEEIFGEDAGYLCDLRPDCDLNQPTTETCGVSSVIPAMLFFNPPIRSDIEKPLEFQLMPTRGLPAIILTVGVLPPRDRGFMIVSVVDCNGRPAAGVHYTIKDAEEEVTVVYVASGVVSPEVTQTDDSGLAAIIGVPAGFARVAAYNDDEELVGEAGVLALPSALTYVTVTPQ